MGCEHLGRQLPELLVAPEVVVVFRIGQAVLGYGLQAPGPPEPLRVRGLIAVWRRYASSSPAAPSRTSSCSGASPAFAYITVSMMATSPSGASQRVRRRPRARSRSHFPGPFRMRAVAVAMLVTGSSAPPSVTQIGLPDRALTVAIAPMMPRGPRGLRNPSAVSTPPPNSESPARNAQGRPGVRPSISMKPLVPSSPGPLNEPNSFWAPWPVSREPSTSRNITAARLPMLSSLNRYL